MKYFKVFVNIVLLNVACTIGGLTPSVYAQESDLVIDEKIDPRLAAIRAYQEAQGDSEDMQIPAQSQIEDEQISDEISTENIPEEENESEVTNTETFSDQDSIVPEFTEELSAEKEGVTAEAEAEEEEEEQDDQRSIVMFLNEVNSTITPNPISSFCFATVQLQNQLKRRLNSFQAKLTFGEIPIDFSAKNVAPGAIASQKITLAGTACTQITGTPQISITRCSVDNMSERQCQNRFLFKAYTE